MWERLEGEEVEVEEKERERKSVSLAFKESCAFFSFTEVGGREVDINALVLCDKR